MLAYQANLDALLTEHMATRHILATHVTDAGQAARENTAWLHDPGATQVGIGVLPTKRGDSVVVVLLGRQVAQALAREVGSVHPPTFATQGSPHASTQRAYPPSRKIPNVHGKRLPGRMPNMKLKLWHGPLQEDEPTATKSSDDRETAAMVATPALDKDKPKA